MASTPTRYARGGNLTNIPKAADVPQVDLTKVLGVDTSNPFLREVRIQQGLLTKETLPTVLLEKTPPDVTKIPGAQK
jgi:hypothetical protein